MTVEHEVDDYTMSDPAVAGCPFDYYAAMRSEAPVHRDPGTGAYWVTHHADVVRQALDAKSLSSRSPFIVRNRFGERAQALWDAAGMRALNTFVSADPPEHDDQRAIGLRLFPNSTVEAMAPQIQKLVHELIDSIIDRETIEFVQDFAARLPGTVVCDEFGFPRADQARFKAWTDAAVGLLDPTISEQREVELVQQLIELFKYLESHMQRAATEMPGRVIHTLATSPKRDGAPFSMLERSWMLLTTFVGGNETTMNMLGMGMRKLAIDPALQAALRREPDKTAAFVEEILRLEGSVQSLLRVATSDLDVNGVKIPQGANVALCIGAANRDERQWPDPDAFKLDRPNGAKHLTFGYGRHSCIGIYLARRELVIAFRALLERTTHFELAAAADSIQQVPLPFHRGIVSLPIRWSAAQ